MDAGLVAVLWLSFHRINHDLVLLRKAMKWLQDNLHGLEEGPAQDINVFRNVEDIVPDINDTDLCWLVNLAVVIFVTRAVILMVFWSIFSHH